MSVVDSTLHVARPTRSAAWLDALQMLTGAGLVLFMWSHMILVSSVILGPGVMNALASFFEVTYMAQVGGPIIFAVMLLHFLLAARKMPFRFSEATTFWRHSKLMRHADTWLWLVQVGAALVVLVLGSIHMWTVLTDLPITAQKSAARIQGGWWLLLYLFLLPMAELHVGIGFYRIGVKWGFIKRRDRARMKRFENGLTLVFVAIGLLTLLRFLFLATN
ncbi:MAG: succinate dehydrogenase/fumarate reductase cytochrome b subunit [Thermodesulfobacteriota bacterium]